MQTLAKYNVKKIVTHCPHCLNSFKHDYPQFGQRIEVVHHTQFIAELAREGKLPLSEPTESSSPRSVTYHDPCYLARVNDVTQSPRELIALTLPTDDEQSLVEMPRRGRDASCCGAGGGRMWVDDAPETRIGASRVHEATATGAETVVTSCPFCLTMMSDGMAAEASDVAVKDIAELLVESIKESAIEKPGHL